jgi:hypothetical protein
MPYGSFQNLQASNVLPKPDIKVGDGATIIMWSDRHACTIIEIKKNGREIVLQQDYAIRTDANGMSDSQSYRFEPNPKGPTYEATIRKNGTFKLKGGSTSVIIGSRSEHYDYIF